jgi:hypothetical protein
MRKPWGKVKIKHFIAAFIIILVGLAAFIFINMNQPAVGTVSPVIVNSRAPATDSLATTQVKGKYVSFYYPSYFEVVQAAKNSGNELETYNYVKRPTPFWFLNLQILTLPTGNVTDDGSYNSRHVNPSRYKLEYVIVNGQRVSVFSDQSGGYAKAAFLPHGNKILTVSLGSADSSISVKLDSVMAQVLNSVSWVN